MISEYGLDPSLLGSGFPAHEICSGERARELAYRGAFFQCTQHDWKIFDWNGAMRRPESHPTQPLIGNSMPDTYIPLNNRRPETPYRLARSIVKAFTALVFGHGRWPQFLSDDPATQDFAEALVKASKLKTRMIRARNIGGSTGTVGLSWGFTANGSPRVRVHKPERIYPLSWSDEDDLIPDHVVELYQYPRDVYEKGKIVRKFFWFRRDWTTHADIVFQPVEVDKNNPMWTIDEDRSFIHGDGFAHFIWIQNSPNEDNIGFDGEPDYEGNYEQLNSVDILNSTSVKGVQRNLDPTLKLKMDVESVGDAIVQKGSENAIVTGTGGDASYLELGGSSVDAGHKTLDKQRKFVLETCQCVIPDPNEVVATATSSVALKVAYAPMLSQADILRDQYGDDGILRMLSGMIEHVRRMNVGGVVEEYEEEVGDDGEVVQITVADVEYKVNLPPRIEKHPILDEEGNPTGEFELKSFPRVPGKGLLWADWPPYFEETADDKQKNAAALTAANGSKPVMSHQTSVEVAALGSRRDPREEWQRIQAEREVEQRSQMDMFPSIGGDVDGPDDLPAGALDDNGEEERPADSAED